MPPSSIAPVSFPVGKLADGFGMTGRLVAEPGDSVGKVLSPIAVASLPELPVFGFGMMDGAVAEPGDSTGRSRTPIVSNDLPLPPGVGCTGFARPEEVSTGAHCLGFGGVGGVGSGWAISGLSGFTISDVPLCAGVIVGSRVEAVSWLSCVGLIGVSGVTGRGSGVGVGVGLWSGVTG